MAPRCLYLYKAPLTFDAPLSPPPAPPPHQNLTTPEMTVEWYTMGNTVDAVEVSIDGVVIGRVSEPLATLDLSSVAKLAPGAHTVNVTAVGATTRYSLDSTVITRPGPAQPASVLLPIDIGY